MAPGTGNFDNLVDMGESLEQRQEEQIPGEWPGSPTRDKVPWGKKRNKVSEPKKKAISTYFTILLFSYSYYSGLLLLLLYPLLLN